MNKLNQTKEILKNNFALVISQVILILFGIIKSKIYAVSFGANGYGVINYLLNIFIFISILSSISVHISSISSISKQKNNFKKLKPSINLIFNFYILLGVIGTLLVVALSPFLIKLSPIFETSNLFFILAPYIFFQVTYLGFSSILQSLGEVSKYVKINIYSALISVSIIYALILFETNVIEYYYFLIIISPFVQSITSYIILKKTLISKYNIKLSFERVFMRLNELKTTIQNGLKLSITGIVSNGTLFLSSFIILNIWNEFILGIYSAAFLILDKYTSVLISAIVPDYHPRLSSCLDEKERSEIIFFQKNLFFIIIIFLSTFLITTSDIILNVLFSKEFNQTSIIIFYGSIGLIFKTMAQIYSYAIVSLDKTKQFLINELLFSITWILLLTISSINKSLTSLGLSYSISYIIYYLISYRSFIRFHIIKHNLYFLFKKNWDISLLLTISLFLNYLYTYKILNYCILAIMFIIVFKKIKPIIYNEN